MGLAGDVTYIAGEHDDASNGRPNRTARRRTAGRIVRWIAIVVVLVLIVTVGYVVFSYQHFVSGITHIDAIPSSNSAATGTGENILLVGDDHRPANATAAELAQLGTTEDGGGDNTDSMMVLHIAGGKATLISFPRDSWVDVPGFGYNKLNAAFALGSENGGGDAGGAQLLIKTIQNLSGLTINHFVRISMLGFYDVAQALGPIQVCLNEAVDDPYSTLDLPAGVSTLNAQQALAFVRQRHGLPEGDLDRVIRQQYFLSTEAKNFLSPGTLLNPVKTQNVLTAVSSAIQTDPGMNFLSLAMQLRSLSGGNLTSTTIPIEGTPTITVDGTPVSIVQVDPSAVQAFAANIVDNSDSAYAAASPAPVGSVSVTVLNGGSVNGAAAQNTATLGSIGFKTGTPGDASPSATTTIEYPTGMEADAKALAEYVPGAAVVATNSVHGVTLILGADGLTVSRTASGTGSAGTGASGTGASGTGTSGTGSSGEKTAIGANGAKIACID